MSSIEVIDQRPLAAKVSMRAKPFTGLTVWSRASLQPEERLPHVDEASLAEFDRLVQMLHANPMPMRLLMANEFEFPACGKNAAAGREQAGAGPLARRQGGLGLRA